MFDEILVIRPLLCIIGGLRPLFAPQVTAIATPGLVQTLNIKELKVLVPQTHRATGKEDIENIPEGTRFNRKRILLDAGNGPADYGLSINTGSFQAIR